MKKTLWILIGAVATLTGCSNLATSRNMFNPEVSATTLAGQVCSNCHGLDGNPASPAFPRLAGQQPGYIVNQLTNFRDKQRVDPVGYRYMWGLSRHLTDEQIAEFADYFSKQTPKRSAQPPADAATMALGKQIFEQGIPEQNVVACMACHGPTAQGMATFPRLAYQHADYLFKQLDVFQNTQGRPGTPMEAISHSLTTAQKTAVAEYLQNIPD